MSVYLNLKFEKLYLSFNFFLTNRRTHAECQYANRITDKVTALYLLVSPPTPLTVFTLKLIFQQFSEKENKYCTLYSTPLVKIKIIPFSFDSQHLSQTQILLFLHRHHTEPHHHHHQSLSSWTPGYRKIQFIHFQKWQFRFNFSVISGKKP